MSEEVTNLSKEEVVEGHTTGATAAIAREA